MGPRWCTWDTPSPLPASGCCLSTTRRPWPSSLGTERASSIHFNDPTNICGTHSEPQAPCLPYHRPQSLRPGTGWEQLRQGPGAVGVEGSLEEVAPVQVRSDTWKMGCRYSRRAAPPSLPQCTLGGGQGGHPHVIGENRLSAREQEGTRWADLASRPLPGGPNLSHRHKPRPRSPLQPGPPG